MARERVRERDRNRLHNKDNNIFSLLEKNGIIYTLGPITICTGIDYLFLC